MTLVPGGPIFPKIYSDRDGTSGKFAVTVNYVNYASGKWPISVDDACGKFVNDTSRRQWQQYKNAYTLYWKFNL